MRSITATEAKNNFGDLLLNVHAEPVSITRNGKEQGVLLSSKEFAYLKQQALQSAINVGIASGDAGELDMQAIKVQAKQRLGYDL